ncbi:MAG TPA: acyl-CoA dehydrogenase family protein [Capsulimonadaceae bacterium]|nr:acyl-CoA dehydrogenase family protein [Capsulimonadaceae bacterium]
MEPSRPDSTDQTTLAKIRELAARFQAYAEETDQGGPSNPLLRENIRLLADAGFYGAGIAGVFGGLALSEDARIACTITLAAACGVTAFTQQQLHSGGGFVGGARDDGLKLEILPQFAAGKVLCGVAFSHLRRPGPPAVRAQKVAGGYKINGEAPWVTGWSMLDAFVLGATAEDGQLLYFYVPIPPAKDSLQPSEPMRLSAMDASDTVRVTIQDLFAEDRFMLFTVEPDSMRRSDYCRITGHAWLPLGCAQGSVDLLRSMAESANRPNLRPIADKLAADIERYQTEALEWSAARADEPDYKQCALAARTGAIKVALRAAGAAIAATGGRAHLLTHPAQRRLREAGFYSTLALTPDVQTALLETYTHA